MRSRLALLAAVACLVACEPNNPSSAPSPTPLAYDQTLSFPIAQDVADLDPALISSPADVDILRNVFSGLYSFDDQLHEVPDIAVGQPAISADGREYTFTLRSDARFSNGDPITAADFRYSWNRAAARQGDFAWLFSLVASTTVVDPTTLKVRLTRPAGYFLTLVGLWPFWVVDQKVIEPAGEDSWFTKPDTLVGSGPFRMTARAPGKSMDFEPVLGWYGGKTGALSRVHIEVVADLAAQLSQYEAGVFSLIGYARQGLSADGATRYTTNENLKKQLTLAPLGITYWVGFNLKTGAFAGAQGRHGRHAFSQAIDRKALVDAVCNQGTACTEAGGGLISKGLRGYLGDGADANVKFDPDAATTEYKAWDPTGGKVKNLAYAYDASPFNKAVCANLVDQWKATLGVTIKCSEWDHKNFLDRRNGSCGFPLFRQSWIADYDHPQDWFDYLFITGARSSGSCYSNAGFNQTIAKADAAAPGELDPGYASAGHTLIEDSAFGGLLYGVQPYLVHSYMAGVGGNALYDNSWTNVRIYHH